MHDFSMNTPSSSTPQPAPEFFCPNRIILEKTVYLQNQIFFPDAPQILLTGRSNVGKSSLLNCLAGRKKLAKTSSVPGKTRSLNFYRAEPYGFYLVDLPGYGYARCSRQERANWARLIDMYLKKATNICLAAALLDCRLPPQQLDMELISYMNQSHIRLLAVLTKSDKSKQAEKMKVKQQWTDILGANQPVIFFSSKTGAGQKQFWEQVRQALMQTEPGLSPAISGSLPPDNATGPVFDWQVSHQEKQNPA